MIATVANVTPTKAFDSIDLNLSMSYNEAVTLFAVLQRVYGIRGPMVPTPGGVVRTILDVLETAGLTSRSYDDTAIEGNVDLPPKFFDLVRQ